MHDLQQLRLLPVLWMLHESQLGGRGCHSGQLQLCDGLQVDVVGAISQPEGPGLGPQPGQREIVRHAGASVDLNGLVDDTEDCVGRHDLCNRNFAPGLQSRK